MGGRFLVDPVCFFVGHSAASRHLQPGDGRDQVEKQNSQVAPYRSGGRWQET